MRQIRLFPRERERERARVTTWRLSVCLSAAIGNDIIISSDTFLEGKQLGALTGLAYLAACPPPSVSSLFPFNQYFWNNFPQ